MSFNRIAVLPKIFTDAPYTAAFLYQMKPFLMVFSSWVFPQLPPICTKTQFSLNNPFKVSTLLFAIHCHLALERSRSSCSSFVGVVVVELGKLAWACDSCVTAINRML